MATIGKLSRLSDFQAQAEVDEVLGASSEVTYEHLSQLKYLTMVFKEVPQLKHFFFFLLELRYKIILADLATLSCKPVSHSEAGQGHLH